MHKVFIVHGYNGTPNGGWRPWLLGELAKNKIYACALPMPSPEKPQKDKWVEMIDYVVNQTSMNEKICLVGHSLGAPAILRYLEITNKNFSHVILVSGFSSILKSNDPENPEKYADVNTFVDESFDFSKIKKSTQKFTLIHGDNDDAVPYERAKSLSNSLACELITIKNGGHLSGLDGFYEFKELLNVILK